MFAAPVPDGPHLYVGCDGRNMQGRRINLTGRRCFTAANKVGSRFLADEVPEIVALLDSGAFSDSPEGRLSPAAALARQLSWEEKASHFWGAPFRAEALVSYDRLIDETWDEGYRVKRRFRERDAERAVAETVSAAAFLASRRAALAPRQLVLSAQGVSAAQYEACARAVLSHALPDDWLGLGGWCILGRTRSWLPVFWDAMWRVVPEAAARGVTRAHLFGCLWTPAVAGLLWLCDAHGIELSVDGSSPILAVSWGDPVKGGARAETWEENAAWWRRHFATMRESSDYRRPPHPRTGTQLPLDLLIDEETAMPTKTGAIEKEARTMTELTFVIPFDVSRLGANETRRMRPGHIRRVKNLAKDAATLIWRAASSPVWNVPVLVDLTIQRAHAMDPDSLIGACKDLIDALFVGRITPDDSERWVRYGQVAQEIAPEWRGREQVVIRVRPQEAGSELRGEGAGVAPDGRETGTNTLTKSPEPRAPSAASLPVASIEPNPLNPRTAVDSAGLSELAGTMVGELGLLEPVVVYEIARGSGLGARSGEGLPVDGNELPNTEPRAPSPERRYRLLAGERRLRAAQKLGWEQIDAVIRPEPDAKTTRLIGLIENLQREPLNPIDRARALKALYDDGMSQGEIARHLGCNQPTVANTIRLLGLPEPVRAMVMRGALTAAHGKALLAWADDPGRCEDLAQVAAAPLSRMKVAHLEQMARSEGRTRRRERTAAGAKGGEIPIAQGEPTQDCCTGCGRNALPHTSSEGLCAFCRHEARMARARARDASSPDLHEIIPPGEIGEGLTRGAAVTIPLPVAREEYQERQRREQKELGERRREREAHVAEWDAALSLIFSRVPPEGNGLGMAIVAAEVLSGISGRVLTRLCVTRGLAHLPPLLDCTGEDVREEAWSALSRVPAPQLMALCLHALLAEDLAVFAETGRGMTAVKWYAGEVAG